MHHGCFAWPLGLSSSLRAAAFQHTIVSVTPLVHNCIMPIDTVSPVQNVSAVTLPRIERNRLSHGGLAGGLREWMEDQVFHILSSNPAGSLPVVVDLDAVGADAVQRVKDALVRKLFNLQIATGRVNPRRSFEEAIEAYRLSGDPSGLGSFICTCKPAVVTGLKREVEDHARRIVSHWSRIPGYAYPRVNNRYTISCHGGDLIFTGVCDLVLAVPENVIVAIYMDDYGDVRDESRDSLGGQENMRNASRDSSGSLNKLALTGNMKEHMRYLALLCTLRDGIPPDAAVRWCSATGNFEIDAITEDALKEALEGLLKIAESKVISAAQAAPSGGAISRAPMPRAPLSGGASTLMRQSTCTAPKPPDIALPCVSTSHPDAAVTVDIAELAGWRRRLDRMTSSSLRDEMNGCCGGSQTEIAAYHIGLYLAGSLDTLCLPAVPFRPSPMAARRAIGIAAIERRIKDLRAREGRGEGIDLDRHVDEVLDIPSREMYASKCGERAVSWRSSRYWWAEWYAQLSFSKKALVRGEAVNWSSNAWSALQWILLPPATEFGPSKAYWRLPCSGRLRVAARWDLKIRYPSRRFLVLSIFDGTAPSPWEEMLCLPMLVPLMNGNPDKVGGLSGVPVRSVGVWLGSGQVRTCDISWEILERTAMASLNTLRCIHRP